MKVTCTPPCLSRATICSWHNTTLMLPPGVAPLAATSRARYRLTCPSMARHPVSSASHPVGKCTSAAAPAPPPLGTAAAWLPAAVLAPPVLLLLPLLLLLLPTLQLLQHLPFMAASRLPPSGDSSGSRRPEMPCSSTCSWGTSSARPRGEVGASNKVVLPVFIFGHHSSHGTHCAHQCHTHML